MLDVWVSSENKHIFSELTRLSFTVVNGLVFEPLCSLGELYKNTSSMCKVGDNCDQYGLRYTIVVLFCFCFFGCVILVS